MSAAAPRISALRIAELLGLPAPTPEQVTIIEAPLAPMLVVAGAGSGKTETMSARVVWLVANDLVAPHEVLGLTFTKKAAGELSERIMRRLRALRRAMHRAEAPGSALDLLDRPTVSTYNSYAASIVADHGLRIGVEPGSRLVTEAGQWQLASRIVEGWDGDLGTERAVSTVTAALLSLAGSLNEHLLTPGQAARRIAADLEVIAALPAGTARGGTPRTVQDLAASLRLRHALMGLVEELQAVKRARDVLDFGDQIALAARLAVEVPEVSEVERRRFPVVLLDEYQDTSHAQTTLLRSLFPGGHPVTAVGDPHQSIYGWRGASASGLARFPAQFADVHGEPAAVRHLSTSWRNDRIVLDVANRLAAPLHEADGGGAVARLNPRPGAGPGSVRAYWGETVADEAEAVADFVAARWRPSSSGAPVSAAVLCRARKQFPLLEAALQRRGLPVEVVGVGGLLSTPEVADLVAFLQVVHDPSRGDALARLLTGPWVNLGARDLHELHAWARALDRADSDGTQEHPSDPRSLVDAVDELLASERAASPSRPGPRPSGRGPALGSEGRARLLRLARMLEHARSLTYLPVPDLLDRCERVLGLDIETALARRDGDVRLHLDELRAVAADFSASAEAATLGGFLAWLESAEAHEDGLDMPLAEPDPDAVQLITVHGAKGLEWDVVAVPGLIDGQFPSPGTGDKGPTDSAWLTDVAALPYHLRGDRQDLPRLAIEEATTQKELEDAVADLKRRAGEFEVLQERRLAYVAVTRARRELLLSGAWWRETGTRAGSRSTFLTEVVDAGLVGWDEGSSQECESAANPLTARSEVRWWPAAPRERSPAEAARSAALVRSAELVDQALRGADESPPGGAAGVAVPAALTLHEAERRELADVSELATLLLEERRRRARSRDVASAPDHLSASALVRMAGDQEAYLRDLRRPVPQAPSDAARLGTEFHAWVEAYFTRPALLDVDALYGGMLGEESLEEVGVPAFARDLARLRRSFLHSPWSRLAPLAVEQEVDTPVAGVTTRTKIDAVFPDPQAPGGVVVVDWKTGRSPRDDAERAARDVQLAVYRLAWARASGLDVGKVRAAYFFAKDGTTVEPTVLLEEAQLDALVRSAFSSGRSSGVSRSSGSSVSSASVTSVPGSSDVSSSSGAAVPPGGSVGVSPPSGSPDE